MSHHHIDQHEDEENYDDYNDEYSPDYHPNTPRIMNRSQFRVSALWLGLTRKIKHKQSYVSRKTYRKH